MRKFMIGGLFTMCVVLSAFTVQQTLSYQIKENYSVKFKNSEVSGAFTKLQGTIAFDENHLDKSGFNVSVETSSIKTGNFLKNSHAKGSNWFDADHYPLIKFISNKFVKTVDGYEVTGTLDLHGVQKQVTIPFVFINQTFKGNFAINRLDYKVGDMQGMSAKVPADIQFELSVPVSKK